MTNFKTNIKAMFASALFAMAALSQAQAGVITIGDTKLTNTTNFQNFDVGTVGSNITNQFAASGLTFVTNATAGMTLTSSTVCNNPNAGVSNQYLFMGVNYPCSPSTTMKNGVSILFDKDVAELSWDGFNRANGSNGYLIEALLDGVVVSSTNFNSRNRFDGKSVMITGSVFDELRFTENGNYQGYFAIDNMAWNTVAVGGDTGEVPLPGTIPLLAIGMVGFGFMRKKQKSA